MRFKQKAKTCRPGLWFEFSGQRFWNWFETGCKLIKTNPCLEALTMAGASFVTRSGRVTVKHGLHGLHNFAYFKINHLIIRYLTKVMAFFG